MKLTPLKAIRKKCLDCSGGSYKEVRLCPCTDCPLWIYRLGHNPNRAGIGKKSPSESLVFEGREEDKVKQPQRRQTQKTGGLGRNENTGISQ